MIRQVGLFLLFTLFLGGCSGEENREPTPPKTGTPADTNPVDDRDAGPSLDDALRMYAEARCDFIEGCNTERAWEVLHGDRAACIEAFSAGDWHVAEGVDLDVEDFERCIDALSETSCDDPLPRRCAFRGSGANGDRCTVDEVCFSTLCFFEVGGATCGTCTDVTRSGDPCIFEEIGSRTVFYCSGTVECGSDRFCHKPGAVNNSCNPAPCGPGADCVNGTCVAQGELGDPCDGPDGPLPDCNHAEGYGCDMNAGECVNAPLADIGESCVDDDRVILCRGHARCSPDERVCVPPTEEGSPCEERAGECAPGLICAGGTCRSPSCD